MFDGKNKAITFSYDDGVTQDIRLIEIFNKYNLKATFNLNSELLGRQNTITYNGKTANHTKVNPQDVKHIYEGHEVAVHTLTHPNLTQIEDDKEVIRQVEQDRINLSCLVGYEVLGMAYPCGGINCDARVASLIRENTPIRYARTIATTRSFEPESDVYQYKMTAFHMRDWDVLFDLAKEFLEIKAVSPKVFGIWGHSYELDFFPERWEIFEEFCKMISNHPDVYYGTNLKTLI